MRAAELYEARCAVCHEVEGGIGTRLDRRVLAYYETARGLFNYVRLAMPYDAPRTLPDEEYCPGSRGRRNSTVLKGVFCALDSTGQ